jgi:hypothetical protein
MMKDRQMTPTIDHVTVYVTRHDGSKCICRIEADEISDELYDEIFDAIDTENPRYEI